MSTMTADSIGPVEVTALADGVVIRLSGALDQSSLPELRSALLRTRPLGCDDVLVDAGKVTDVTEEALAVLVAAPRWAYESGGRCSFAAMSQALLGTARAYGIEDLLPRLPGPGGRADAAAPARHQRS